MKKSFSIIVLFVSVLFISSACAQAEKKTKAQSPTPTEIKENQSSAIKLQPQQSSLSAGTSSLAQPAGMTKELPVSVATWEGVEHNFGTIKQGEVVKHTFRFKNTGEHDLLISNVKPSCGCTTPNYSKQPVKPGEEGFVEVAFNSAHKQGFQHKTVTVSLNTTEMRKVLRFKGEIVLP